MHSLSHYSTVDTPTNSPLDTPVNIPTKISANTPLETPTKIHISNTSSTLQVLLHKVSYNKCRPMSWMTTHF